MSAALNSWIASVPNGSTLVFPAGSCYRLDGDAGLNLTGRSGLTLIGTGALLQLATTGASNFSSAFFLQGSTHIVIRGFAVDGLNPMTGTTGARATINEHINAAVIRAGSAFVEFDHVSWDRLRGFGPLISADGGTAWPTDITIHDSVIRGGEMGVGIVAGRRIRIIHNAINDSVYIAIDLEPDASQSGGGGFEDVTISDNDVTTYAWGGAALSSWFLAACPADAVLGTAVMNGLTIERNHVIRGAATADNGNYDVIGGLAIRANKTNPKTNFVIRDNWTETANTKPAAVMFFDHVAGLTITGNVQPLVVGRLASITNSTNVVVQ